MTGYDDLGFTWRQGGDGSIFISFKGKVVTTLKGARTAEFLAEAEGVEDDELQQYLARVTGQFQRGNERMAKNHPRNRR